MTEVNMIKTVSFHNGLEEIFIPIGMKIVVDLKKKTGYFEGNTFDIFRDEYSITA